MRKPIVMSVSVFAAVGAALCGQEPPNPLVAVIDARIEEFYDIWASDLEREEAGERLVALGPAAASRLVDAALADARDRHGWRGGALLEAMRDAAGPAVPRLLDATRDEDPVVRALSMRTLATIGPYVRGFDPAAVPAPPRAGITEDGAGLRDEWERLQARCALGADAALDELVAVAGDRDVTAAVRLSAVEFLGHRGATARSALPALRELRAVVDPAFRNPDGSMMEVAAITGAIARIAPATPDAFEDLELAVAGRWRGYVPESDARIAIAKLATLGERSVTALCRGVRQPRATVRLAAIRALERIGPLAVDALPDLELLIARESLDDDTRDAARRAAAAIGGEGGGDHRKQPEVSVGDSATGQPDVAAR